MPDYKFTTDFFSSTIPVWEILVDAVKPSRFIEIGSYEGRSACWLIERCGKQRPFEIHCIDTWQGSMEHNEVNTDMAAVEMRFDANVAKAIAASPHPVKVVKHKMSSYDALARMAVAGEPQADMIYIDGSHKAADVLADAVLAFRLLRLRGIMMFDDYLWSPPRIGADKRDVADMPKTAIDAFVLSYFRKMAVIPASTNSQCYLEKIAE